MKKTLYTTALLSAAAFTILSAAAIAGDHGIKRNARVAGRVFPERSDDLSWENELVGFRLYGPATQKKGERAFGYDIFFKYPDRGLVLELLYGPETNPLTWEIRDSLLTLSPELAERYVSTFSYHLDHGLGMDPYPVGPTLGAGVCALLSKEGEILFPWCYSDVEILENGPDRFTAHLTFAPEERNGDTLTEHRLISLEAGSHLNRTKVWYEGQTRPHSYIIGFPRCDNSEAMLDSISGCIAYADPTDKRPGNTAMLGLVFENPMKNYGERGGHISATGTVAPGDTITYNWGFTWPKSDIDNMDDWKNYLLSVASARKSKCRAERENGKCTR